MIDEKRMMTSELQELPMILREKVKNYKKVQKEVLADILKVSSDCEYGRKYDFKTITGIETFRVRVPITDFSDYKSMIERMKKGEESILFPGRTKSFAVSSGTTGNPKYIPESEAGDQIKKLVSNMRMVEMLRMIPDIMEPGKKILAITNASIYGRTEAGIPAGSASGQTASAAVMQEKMVLPAELLTMDKLTGEQNDYLTTMFSAAESNIAGLVCNNVAHFHMMVHLLNEKVDMIISDIHNGTISLKIDDNTREILMKRWKKNPERANQLQQIYEKFGEFKVADVWPSFMAVSSWLSATVGRTTKEFRSMFPENTVFLEWGYGASEGKFNIPITKNATEGVLSVFGYFFEFLPIGGKETLLLEDTVPGGEYELVITSYSGFYRYNVHDIVRIDTNDEGFKTIEFLCKTSDKVEIQGKSLYASDLLKLIEEYEKTHQVMFRLFQATVESGKLKILLEGMGNWDVEIFTQYIKEKLDVLKIPFGSVERKPEGYRDHLFAKSVSKGKTINTTKLPVFI